MTKKAFTEGRGYSREDWEAVDSPAATDEQFAKARPFAEALPTLAAAARRGRPRLDNPKVQVSIRLDPDVLDKLKASGPGWQSRVNDILKAAV